MALSFPYRQVSILNPAITLAGATQRPRPLVDLSITGPARSLIRRAVLDTGADEIVLEEADAVLLGIDLTNAPAGVGRGFGSGGVPLRFATVELRLTDGIEYRTWPALVGFSPVSYPRILLGYAHGLQYFSATFHGDRQVVELQVNPTYPGT